MANKWLNIGAAWKRKDKQGKEFLSIKLNKEKIEQVKADEKGDFQVSMFPNDKKGNEKRPDYNFAVKAGEEVGSDLPF